MLSRIISSSVRISIASTKPALNYLLSKSFHASSIVLDHHGKDCDHDHDHDHDNDPDYAFQHSVHYPPVSARIGSNAPSFHLEAVVDNEIKKVSLEDYAGKWVYFFFYPKDFTFVCPTEIIAFSERIAEFEKLNCQVLGVSCDSVNSHLAWIRQPRLTGGLGYLKYPLLADMTKVTSARYGALMEDDGHPLRASYLINPEGKLMHLSMNQNDVGRSVDETLRLLNAYQYAAKHGEVCPANWTPGERTMVPDAVASQEYFASGATLSKSSSKTEESTHVVTVSSPAELDSIVKSGKKVVTMFSAQWCGKCAQIAPVVEGLAADYKDITFVKVDKDAAGFQNIVKDWKVDALPSFRFFNKGKESKAEITGYKKKLLKDTVDEL